MIKTTLLILLTSSFCVGQSVMQKVESKVCKCIDGIEVETDAILDAFHKRCITTLLEKNQQKLLEEYGTTDSDQPKYLAGHQDAQKINTLLVSELILNCDTYYEQSKKSLQMNHYYRKHPYMAQVK